MVNVLKELPDIAFQDPASPSVVSANFISELAESVQRFMGPLAQSTRERVRYKSPIKEWVELPTDGMMEQSVSDQRLMYLSRLGVVYTESLI